MFEIFTLDTIFILDLWTSSALNGWQNVFQAYFFFKLMSRSALCRSAHYKMMPSLLNICMNVTVIINHTTVFGWLTMCLLWRFHLESIQLDKSLSWQDKNTPKQVVVDLLTTHFTLGTDSSFNECLTLLLGVL